MNCEKGQDDFTFIFNILSETFMGFVYIYLVLEIKNVVNLIKTRFCWKRAAQLCVTMWKRSTAMTSIIVVHNAFIQISYCRKLTLASVFLSFNIMTSRQAQRYILWPKVILILWPFTWHKWIMWIFCGEVVLYIIYVYTWHIFPNFSMTV